MDKPKLLAPAGDLVSLEAAIDAGADEIYFGVKGFNMRANAKNFEISQIKKIVELCHKNSVKAYLTINIIIYDDELDHLKKVLDEAKKAGVDAVICWDHSVIELCKKNDIDFHISTQASVSNYESVKHYSSLGASRIVLARECTLEQVKSLKEKIRKDKLDVEIETFIHGAMCVSVSGRCFISQFLYGKSANRGECIQPCRRSYKVTDKETGDELELGNDYVLSPKDMSSVDIIDKLIDAGIDCFKIEGRMRSPEYVANVVKAYRMLIDEYLEKKRIIKSSLSDANDLIYSVYNRGFSKGFHMGKPINEWTDEYGSKATEKKIYLGKVKNYYKRIKVIEMKLETTDLRSNSLIMVQGPTTGVVKEKIDSIHLNGKEIETARKKQVISFRFSHTARPNDKVFCIEDSSKIN